MQTSESEILNEIRLIQEDNSKTAVKEDVNLKKILFRQKDANMRDRKFMLRYGNLQLELTKKILKMKQNTLHVLLNDSREEFSSAQDLNLLASEANATREKLLKEIAIKRSKKEHRMKIALSPRPEWAESLRAKPPNSPRASKRSIRASNAGKSDIICFLFCLIYYPRYFRLLVKDTALSENKIVEKLEDESMSFGLSQYIVERITTLIVAATYSHKLNEILSQAKSDIQDRQHSAALFIQSVWRQSLSRKAEVRRRVINATFPVSLRLMVRRYVKNRAAERVKVFVAEAIANRTSSFVIKKFVGKIRLCQRACRGYLSIHFL